VWTTMTLQLQKSSPMTTPAANTNTDANDYREQDRWAYKVHSLILYFLDPPISATTTHKAETPNTSRLHLRKHADTLIFKDGCSLPTPPPLPPLHPRKWAYTVRGCLII